MNRFIHLAYLRDGQTVHTGEPLLLAMLLHTKGARNSKDELDIRKIMRDINLEDDEYGKTRA